MERHKILIVDDDPDLRRALKLRLRANHYDTLQAGDGYAAIAVANKERPSLIILDLGRRQATATPCSRDCRATTYFLTFQ